MVHQFEGFLDGISEQRRDFISKVLKNQGFSDGSVVIEPVGKPGDNFGADVRRIIAQRNGETFRVVAKIKPQNNAPGAFEIAPAFLNESLMYSHVLSKYTEFEEQAGIPESDRLVHAAYYGALLDEPNMMILLEDLQIKGYTILDRKISLPDEAVKLLLKSIASLHAYSFVWQRREPETFAAIKDKLIDIWEHMFENEQINNMYKTAESDILLTLEDEKYKNHIRGKITKLGEMMSVRSKDVMCADSAYHVIQHGDAWTNNIMFKVQNEKIVSCCPIDYQISKAGSPATDILYVIFVCNQNEAVARHYHEWIDYYYLQLDKTLNYFGLKADSVYKRACLDADLKRKGELAIAITAFGSTILVRDDDDAAKIKNAMGAENDMVKMFEASKITSSSSSTITKFKARVEGVIDNCIELRLV